MCVRSTLGERAETTVQSILSRLGGLAESTIRTLVQEYETLLSLVNEVATDPERLFELEDFSRQVPDKVESLKSRTETVGADLQVRISRRVCARKRC